MKSKISEFTSISILIAVTVVLQTLGAVFPIKVAGISISLVMIPLTVAACFFGIKGGAIVGTAFGLTVFVHSIIGLDAAGATIFAINPFFTFCITVVRGLLAGVLTAVIYKLVKAIKISWLKYMITGLFSTIFNTGIFIGFYVLLFNDLLVDAANSSGYTNNVFGFIIFAVVGINFLFEALTTLALSPAVCKALEKTHR